MITEMVTTRSTTKSECASQAARKMEVGILIRQQLTSLLHAQQCWMNEQVTTAARTRTTAGCDFRHCAAMKVVLNHMRTCAQNRSTCTYPHCGSSRMILAHWKTCQRNSNCGICKDILPSLTSPKLVLRRSPRKRKTDTGKPEADNQQSKARAVCGDASVCSICDDRMRNRIFVNCGHTSCEVCVNLIAEVPLKSDCKFCGIKAAQRAKGKLCPWCRQHICIDKVKPMHLR